MKIFNVEVMGLEAALRASGYPKRTEFADGEVFDKALARGQKLGNVPAGTGHDCFLKGIVVQADVTYTAYWSQQFQRYHFADIVSSSSKMHRLTKMKVADCCNRYTLPSVTEQLQVLIDAHENFDNLPKVDPDPFPGSSFGSEGPMIAISDGKREYLVTKGDLFCMILSNCPQGIELTMRIVTNYLQLKTIHKQRRLGDADRLPDDWGVFCDWIESLPHFGDLCLGKKP